MEIIHLLLELLQAIADLRVELGFVRLEVVEGGFECRVGGLELDVVPAQLLHVGVEHVHAHRRGLGRFGLGCESDGLIDFGLLVVVHAGDDLLQLGVLTHELVVHERLELLPPGVGGRVHERTGGTHEGGDVLHVLDHARLERALPHVLDVVALVDPDDARHVRQVHGGPLLAGDRQSHGLAVVLEGLAVLDGHVPAAGLREHVGLAANAHLLMVLAAARELGHLVGLPRHRAAVFVHVDGVEAVIGTRRPAENVDHEQKQVAKHSHLMVAGCDCGE